MQTILEVRNLAKSFKKKQVLKGESFSIAEGEINFKKSMHKPFIPNH